MRGFTLTELMVAMSGGLMISIAVFMLARQASRFYSREGRTSTATLASVIGFERLRADITRAGFMASPNIRADAAVCNKPPGTGWPAYLNHLQSVFIEDISSSLPTMFVQGGHAPHSITLAGNYASSDQYEVRNIAESTSNLEVYLAVNSNAVQRISTVAGGTTVVPQATLDAIFGTGRAARIVDPSGRHHYGQIIATIGGSQPRVVLSDDSPEIKQRSAGAPECGIIGVDTGSLINPVNIVRYTMKSLYSNSEYSTLYAHPLDQATRYDLVREELNVDGTAISTTLELIAEYAVDLSFVLTGMNPDTNKLETTVAEKWADATTGPDAHPQRIRAIRATLAVRSREADHTTPQLTGTTGYLRFGVGSGGTAPYARVRSVSAQIALNNQLGVAW